jgi:hypothetical protein
MPGRTSIKRSSSLTSPFSPVWRNGASKNSRACALCRAAPMCCFWDRQAWGNPNQHTTPLGHSVALDPTISVVDPRHPLHGQAFTLIDMTYDDRFGPCCVVELCPHEHRLIPVQATHLAGEPIDISPSPLSLRGVAHLLRVVQDIQHASQGVNRDVSSPCPGGAAPERRPTCPSSTVAPPLQRTTTAGPTGSHRGGATGGGPFTEPITI